MTARSFADDIRELEATTAAPFDAPAANPHKAIAKAQDAETYPCESCGGTGRYRGPRVHQPESHCFACNGRGWFKTSTQDRFKARKQAADRKAKVANEARALFLDEHKELVARLGAEAGWNSFAREMLGVIAQKGALSDNQLGACQRMIAKIDARNAEREAERAAKDGARAANSGAVDVSAIEALFATARSNGLKKLAFTTDVMAISPAPDHGKNAGALYVKAGGVYQGKVVGGKFLAGRDATAETLPTLIALAADPSGFARVTGKRTGRCCCCNRELTDPESIAAGIGPVCAANWGL